MKLPKMTAERALKTNVSNYNSRGGLVSKGEKMAPYIQPAMQSSTNKSAIYGFGRPGFTGQAANMTCNSNENRDHTISWELIRDGYVAALNPTSKDSKGCEYNLGLLYDSVLLTRDNKDIQTACADKNRTDSNITSIDKNILTTLNSSIQNLRCGYSSSNQSISSAIDVRCSDQSYDSTVPCIYITGNTATQIASYMGMDGLTLAPKNPTMYTTSNKCSVNGCTSGHVQSSDCIGDVGAAAMSSLNVPVFYKVSGGWKQFK